MVSGPEIELLSVQFVIAHEEAEGRIVENVEAPVYRVVVVSMVICTHIAHARVAGRAVFKGFDVLQLV